MALKSEISNRSSRDHPTLKEIFTTTFSEESFRKGLSFQPRSTDIIIVTPPKCGTTWMQQIVHQLRTGGDMDFDTLHGQIPWFETAHDFGYDLEGEQKAKPRGYKTHTAYNACPKGGKYIVIFRDPCCAAYSFYKFYSGTIIPENFTLNEFVTELWLKMGDPPNPRISLDVSYFTVLLSWIEHRNDPNVLILFFEEMKENLENVVRAVAAFMGICDEKNIHAAVEMSTFEFMKANAEKFAGKPKKDLAAKLLKPVVLIRTGSTTEALQVLSDDLKAAIQKRWVNEITKATGYQTYEDLRRELRNECPLKH